MKTTVKNSIYRYQFGIRKKGIRKRYHPQELFEQRWFCSLAIVLFLLVDLFCLKTLWNLTMTASPLLVWLISSGCAAALDIPLAVAAIFVKRCRLGLVGTTERNLILVLALAVFGITFIFSFYFRLNTAYLSFDIGTTSSTLTNNILSVGTEEGTEQNAAIQTAAIFNAMLPLLTSLSSFILSYISCADPEVEQLKSIERERILLQKNIGELKAVIRECDDPDAYSVVLAEKEKELYEAYLAELNDTEQAIKQEVRLLLMPELETPEELTGLAKAASKSLRGYRYKTEAFTKRMPDIPDYIRIAK